MVRDVRHFAEHLGYAPRRRAGKHQHDEHHRHHAERHQYLHDVVEECRERAVIHIPRDDIVAAEPHHRDYARERHALHERHRDDQHLFGRKLELLHQRAYLLELFRLVILSDEGLDGAYRDEVFLSDLVHVVVLFEHLGEAGEDDDYAHDEPHHDDGKGDREHYGELCVDGYSHAQREGEHDGSAHQHADDHHIGHLHVGDVGGETGDQPRRGESVKIGEAEILHFVVYLLPDVGAESRGGIGGKFARKYAEKQGKQSHDHHHDAAYHDEIRVGMHGEYRGVRRSELQGERVLRKSLFQSHVDDLGHDDGD